MESDGPALARTLAKPTYQNIYHELKKRADVIFTKDEAWPLTRPVIHPLQSYPKEALEQWQKSWRKHLAKLEKVIRPDHVS